MTSLLDIGELFEDVLVRDKTIRVTGIGADGLLHLFTEFPELRALVSGARSGEEITSEKLMGLAPNIIASAIAAGTGHPGDKEYITAAARLTLGEQFLLVQPILKLTFPSGIGPFVVGLTDIINGARADASGWASATKLPVQ